MRKLLLSATIIIGGCASNSGVVPIGKDTFMVSRQAATGFSGSGILKAEAFQEATRHCEQSGKFLQVINTFEASPPYILANFPKAEIQFMCLTSADRELGRPKLVVPAETALEIKDIRTSPIQSTKSKDIYAELLKLDDLRKKGILTEAEFDAEKKKLLAN